MTTPEEYFDVVDGSDNVIDRQPRSQVHRQRLRHRAIHVFVFRADGMLLIHRRSNDKEEFPGVWTSSASGHVSSGETYNESAPRELSEELGITAPLARWHRFDACAATGNEFTALYSCEWNGDVRPDPTEIAEIEWVRPRDIEQRIRERPDTFSPAFRLLFGWYQLHGRVSSCAR